MREKFDRASIEGQVIKYLDSLNLSPYLNHYNFLKDQCEVDIPGHINLLHEGYIKFYPCFEISTH